MRWSNAGSHEVVSMLGLAIRVGTTTERSPASLDTCSALSDHGWAPCAPGRPEALLAVQTVHVANVGEYLCSIGHYRLNEGI